MRVSVRTSLVEGRTRAGMRFSRDPRVVEVTNEQLAALEADPLIKVEPCADDTPETPAVLPVERPLPVESSQAVDPKKPRK